MNKVTSMADRLRAITAHEERHESFASIAAKYGVTKQGVMYWCKTKDKIVKAIQESATIVTGDGNVEENPMPDSGEDCGMATKSAETLRKENKGLKKEMEVLKDKLAYYESLSEILSKDNPQALKKKRLARQSTTRSAEKEGRTSASSAPSPGSPGTDTTNTSGDGTVKG